MGATKTDERIEFFRFNPWRMRRGVEAVEIKIIYPDGDWECLWMSKSDLEANIRQHGNCEAYERGLACYRLGVDPGPGTITAD